MPNFIRWVSPLLILPLLNASSFGQSNSQVPSELSFTISGAQVWTDTGTDLIAGDSLSISAEAKPGSENCGSAGTASPSSDKLPLGEAPAGTLIARTSESGAPMLVGSSRDLHADVAGHLLLGVNEAGKSDCSFVVKVKIAHAQRSAEQSGPRAGMKDQLSSAAKVWMQGQFGKSSPTNSSEASNAVSSSATTGTAPASSSGLKVPTVILDAELRKNIDDLPRRVHDHLGNPGDMVNFVIVGSEERAKAALDAADWHLADVDSKEAFRLRAGTGILCGRQPPSLSYVESAFHLEWRNSFRWRWNTRHRIRKGRAQWTPDPQD